MSWPNETHKNSDLQGPIPDDRWQLKFNQHLTKSNLMQTKFLATLLIILSPLVIHPAALADAHSAGTLTLEPRQAPAIMTVTSVRLTDGGGVISAVGDMGEYGKVYTTYEMTLDPSRGLYVVSGEGRGFMTDGAFASGQFQGIAYREGSIFTMYNTVNITGSTQNFDVITFDALENTLTVKAYILK